VCRSSTATVVLSDAMAERWRRELRRRQRGLPL